MREMKFRLRIKWRDMGGGSDISFATYDWYGLLNTTILGEILSVDQYTGLKDNTKWEQLSKEEQFEWLGQGETQESWNGKEIYEGDTVRYSCGGIEQEKPLVIEMPDIYISINERDSYMRIEEMSIEIIGNIYENPELLGEK